MSELKPALNRFDLTMIAIGSTIGSGIFLTPSIIAGALHSPLLIIAVWVAGGLMTLAGALTLSELSTIMPRVGGVYVYLREAYGGLVGFLYGWAYFLVVNTGGIAALSIAFATYFGYFIPLGPDGITSAAIAGIAIVTTVNLLGVKMGGIFSDVFTVLKIAGIFGLVLVGLLWGTFDPAEPSNLFGELPDSLESAFAVAMVGVLWSYGGWQHATFASSEALNPKRDLPVAMILGAIAVTLLYALTNIAYLSLLSPAEIGSSSRVASDAVETVLGPIGAGLIAIAIFISTFGTTGIYTLTAPRIYYAMAKDGVFFDKAAEVHPRFRTPAVAILLQSIWATVLILFWGTFENLISYVVFTDWIFFTLAGASIFVFRRRHPQSERAYKAAGYPFTPLVFVALSTWFVINTLIEKPIQAWAGLVLLGIGVPVFFFWKARSVRSDQSKNVERS